MPLAFSTLGCPGGSLAQVIATAHAAGATGLELRAADGEFVHPGMSEPETRAVAAALAEAGLQVLSLASYVRVCAPDPEGREGMVDDELAAAVDLASRLGARCVRVFPGAGLPPAPNSGPDAAMAAADRRGAARLNAAAGRARALGVVIVLETHDSHPRAEDVNRILAGVDKDAPVQVVWDLMHPWRYGEAPETTAQLLGNRLAYAQYKDGVRTPGTHDVTLTLPGDGELPLREMRDLVAEVLAGRGVGAPWVSLEWERAWHPELPPVAEALAALANVLA